jgi:hypothetical protein
MVVDYIGSNMEKWDRGLKELLQSFANEISKPIHVWNSHGMPRTPEQVMEQFRNETGTFEENDLYFAFWCSPAEDTSFGDDVGLDMAGIFGGKYDELMGMSYPTRLVGAGTILASVEGNNTYPFGEVVGNIVYINWDLPHVDYGVGFMADALPIINNAVFGGDGISIADWQAKLVEEREKRSKELYIEACLPRLTSRSQSLRANIESLVLRQNQLIAEMAANVRNVKDNEINLNAVKIAERSSLKNKDKFGREWDALKSNENVKELRFDTGAKAMVVKTIPIISQWLDDGTRRELGEYEVWFYTQADEGDSSIGLRNLTQPQRWGPHPHATGEFSICWGNVATAVSMLVSEHEYSAATEIILRFLGEPNSTDDWGRHVYDWPVAEKNSEYVEPFGEDNNYGERVDEDYCSVCDYSPCECCTEAFCMENEHGTYDSCQDNYGDCPCC